MRQWHTIGMVIQMPMFSVFKRQVYFDAMNNRKLIIDCHYKWVMTLNVTTQFKEKNRLSINWSKETIFISSQRTVQWADWLKIVVGSLLINQCKSRQVSTKSKIWHEFIMTKIIVFFPFDCTSVIYKRMLWFWLVERSRRNLRPT